MQTNTVSSGVAAGREHWCRRWRSSATQPAVRWTRGAWHATLRMLNEAIDTEPVDGIIAFRCECGAARLQSTHPLRRDQYEAVRLNARRFVIAPGHAVTELEHEVERHAEHALVDTHRHTSDLADRTDPASWAPTEDPGAGRLVADTDEAAGNELLRPIESPGSLDPTRGVFAT